MKKDIHPEYREVVFKDISCEFSFKEFSSVKTNEKIKWDDGKEYPLYKVEISSASHPFFTGDDKIIDIEGRVDRFKKKFKLK